MSPWCQKPLRYCSQGRCPVNTLLKLISGKTICFFTHIYRTQVTKYSRYSTKMRLTVTLKDFSRLPSDGSILVSPVFSLARMVAISLFLLNENFHISISGFVSFAGFSDGLRIKTISLLIFSDSGIYYFRNVCLWNCSFWHQSIDMGCGTFS